MADEGHTKTALETCLDPLVGRDILVSLHHDPPTPFDPTRWGGGCCLWEPSGECPAGHHLEPLGLLAVNGRGVLQHDASQWWLDAPDGRRIDLPFALLEGHRARVVGVTVLDPTVPVKDAKLTDSDDLITRVVDLRDFLARLQRKI